MKYSTYQYECSNCKDFRRRHIPSSQNPDDKPPCPKFGCDGLMIRLNAEGEKLLKMVNEAKHFPCEVCKKPTILLHPEKEIHLCPEHQPKDFCMRCKSENIATSTYGDQCLDCGLGSNKGPIPENTEVKE